jgi:hypothetical protein
MINSNKDVTPGLTLYYTDSAVRKSNNIAWKGVDMRSCSLKVDLMLRDSIDDTGDEPYPKYYNPNMRNSPDIWVRHINDAMSTPQDPLPDNTNSIHVRIKNIGGAISTGRDILKLYWAKAGTSLAWDSCWNGNRFSENGPLMGDFIDSVTIPPILGRDTIMIIPWKTPDPNNYCGIVNNNIISDFYLLARIESELDTMKSPETANIDFNVRYNNNIAMRSIKIENSASHRLLIRNTENDTGIVPDTSAIVCNSPDIWVYHYERGFSDQTHQAPIAGVPNKVYVRVNNTGCLSYAGGDVLKLYWAKRGTGLAWDSCWNGNRFPNNGPLMGNYIDSAIISALNPNGKADLSFDWKIPPYPYDYSGIGDSTQFSLLARIEDSNGYLTSLETEDLESNVRNNRNIAWKHITVETMDAMIRDYPEDTGGALSNPPDGNMWNSPDIWARRGLDYGTTHQYLIPDLNNPSVESLNTIHVRIRNRGNFIHSFGDAQLFLYCAKANEADYSDWNSNNGTWKLIDSILIKDNMNTLTIDKVDSTIVFSFWWKTYPEDYNEDPKPWCHYFLAVIKSNIDYIGYSGDPETDIKNNNNIAGKRVYFGEKMDLMIRDMESDTGKEYDYSPNANIYNSPDIWVRKAKDNGLEPQNPVGNSTNYVYVRVKNIGDVPSSETDTLCLYWAKAGTGLWWPHSWEGKEHFDNGAPKGGPIGKLSIPPLNPGQEMLMVFPWNVPAPGNYLGIDGDMDIDRWHFCLLAHIESTDDTLVYKNGADFSNYVTRNNNIAWKNLSVVDPSEGWINGVIVVGNVYQKVYPFRLEFQGAEEDLATPLYKEAEITIKLSDKLFEIWKRGGRRGENIRILDDKTLLIIGNNAFMDNLIFEPKEYALLDLRFNFLTQEVTGKTTYRFSVVQRDVEAKRLVGGETYLIRKNTRDLFYAGAGGDTYTDIGATVTLSAETINEPAVYNWYDQNDSLIYEGIDFVTSVSIAQKYKLEIIALTDGYKDYAEVDVKLNPNRIKTVFPNPLSSNQLDIEYKINEADNAYISINHYYYSNIFNNYILDLSTDNIQLNLQNYPAGLYTIVLICNGVISDTKTFIKQ